MEYSFRPQWRPWNVQSGYSPACGRCGKFHKFYLCNSINQRCYLCGKFGHYSSKCFSKAAKNRQSTLVHVKSRKQKERDTARMTSYIERTNIIRALPFSGMRNSAFVQYLDIANVLKTELNGVKLKLSEEKRKNSEQQKCIQDLKFQLNNTESVKSERDQLKQELENMRQHKEQIASPINVQEYVHQIQELQDQVIEKDKTVKMVQDLYYLRSTEFTDEIQTLKKEKTDLCSKVQIQADSISQLTYKLQDLNHEYQLSGFYTPPYITTCQRYQETQEDLTPLHVYEMAEGGFSNFMFENANGIENCEDIVSNLPIPNDVDSLEVLELRIIAKTQMNGGFCYLAFDQNKGRILRPIFNISPGQCCWPKKGPDLKLDDLYIFQVIADPDQLIYSTQFPHCNEDLIVTENISQQPLHSSLVLLPEPDIQAIYNPQVSYSMPPLRCNEDLEFENEFASLLSPQPPLKSLLLSRAKLNVQDIFWPNVIKEHRYVDENTDCSSAGILRSKASFEYNESKNKYYCEVECVSGTYNMPVKVIDIGDIDTKPLTYPDALIVLGLGRPFKGDQGIFCPARCYLLVVGIYPLQKQNGQPLNQSCMKCLF